MKVFKKMLAIGASGLLAASLCVMSHAAIESRTSAYGYIGGTTYYATAKFSSGKYVTGSGQMHSYGEGGKMEQNGTTDYGSSAVVNGILYAPSNYGVHLSRTVRN